MRNTFPAVRPILIALPRLAAGAALLLAGGCAVGPNYRRPAVAVPSAFKEAAGWKAATPGDGAPKGTWWKLFGDPALDGLEASAMAANQTLAQAASNYEAARQLARADRATLLPPIDLSGSAQRGRTSSASRLVGGSSVIDRYSASLGTSWVPDFWGRIRRQTEADVAAAQAGAADLANARLSIQAELARDYVALRVADEKARLLDDATRAYGRTLQISRNKYAAGVSANSDVLSAEAQLDATRAQEVDVGVQRAALEHAIAVLVGVPPAGFSVDPRQALDLPVPSVPPQMPSALLERRPDVAAAERAVAEANARVGVQTAGYFPTITLTGDVGYDSTAWHRLFNAANRTWSLGSDAAEILFNWGERRAQWLGAKASYEASVASYRQTVLGAFQQVEDDLAALRILAREAAIQQAAVSEAAQARQIAVNEYDAGTVDYTTVVTAEVAELSDREAALATRGGRLSYGILLIEGLGGGWASSDLPGYRDVVARKSRPAAMVAAPGR